MRVNTVWRLRLHKITVSKWFVELADCFWHRDVSLVFNSVDTDQFHAAPRGRQSVPMIGLLHHNPRRKGIGVSLDAIRHTIKIISRLRLLTFGTGPFDEPLPDVVEHIHWQQPAQNSIQEIYGACDVWLCGRTAEGFHPPPLEAMACRCPFVSTAGRGSMDIVAPRVNGFLAAVNDPEELGRHLVSVLNRTEAKLTAVAFGSSRGLSVKLIRRDDAVRGCFAKANCRNTIRTKQSIQKRL